MTYSTIAEAVSALACGGIVVVMDDEDRENEADLIMGAAYATPEKVAFFLEHTSGFLCVALPPERAEVLKLDLMVRKNTEAQSTAFLVTVDVRAGTSTGISAADRAATCRALADERTAPDDLAKPGHIMPLRARPGGVLKRAGHTEAGVDLCRMANIAPAALLCELVTHDRLEMLRGQEAAIFARTHGLPLITVAELVRHRATEASLVARSGQAQIPTPRATFTAISYQSVINDVEHLAWVLGDVADGRPVLVRVHSECITGDLFESLRCDCGLQLRQALSRIATEGRGVVVYLRGHEGRGIGIGHKLRAYHLQSEQGLDTVDANTALGLPIDTREYGIGAQILSDLGAKDVLLMTNNPHKYTGLKGYGIRVVDRVPIQTTPTPDNIGYLLTKRERMSHWIDVPEVLVADRSTSVGQGWALSSE